jgi:hypothetical protein
MENVADGESFVALCYRSVIGLDTPPATLWASTTVADTLNRKPYALKTGTIFEDTRTDEEVKKATEKIVENPKPVIQRDSNGKAIGQSYNTCYYRRYANASRIYRYFSRSPKVR